MTMLLVELALPAGTVIVFLPAGTVIVYDDAAR